jgi:hypothetical protein
MQFASGFEGQRGDLVDVAVHGVLQQCQLSLPATNESVCSDGWNDGTRTDEPGMPPTSLHAPSIRSAGRTAEVPTRPTTAALLASSPGWPPRTAQAGSWPTP